MEKMKKNQIQHSITIWIFTLLLSFIMASCRPAAEITLQPQNNLTPISPSDTEEVFVPIAVSGSQGSSTAKAEPSANRDMAPDVPDEHLTELVQGNNAFAFDLYHAIRVENGNLFYSPYSLSTALAMTYAGARGETEAQMKDVLHYTLPQQELHPSFNALDLDLTKPADNGPNEEDFQLNLANSLWAQEGFSFLPDYLTLIETNYGAGIRLVDFIDSANREQARLTINDWVSDGTEEKIKDLFPKGIFTENTRLVLANAIYFKADWAEPFLHGTHDDQFFLLDGSSVTVPMMSRRADARFFEGEGYQAVEIPYQGEQIRMIVLLPDEGQFEAVETSLSNELTNTVLRGLELQDVKLYMPKFEYDASLTLVKTLEKMGMPDAFDYTKSDFSGMVDDPTFFIAHVVHKAFVAVDEFGTEAAAASGVVGEIESMPVTMTINRSFIYFIYDAETGAILFLGRVLDP